MFTVMKRGFREAALLVLLYVAYSASRLFADDSFGPAAERARDLLGFERWLLLDVEGVLNSWFAAQHAVGLVASYWYATLHYIVTAVVLVWLYRRGWHAYQPARQALAIATVLALVLYLLVPMAPPRLLPDYIDVLQLHSAAGWWGGDASAPRGLGGLTNQLAAFPSLHAGWALWVALVVRRHVRNPAVRGLAWFYAAGTTVVIVGTGNHWLLDAVVGWLVVLVGWEIARTTSSAAVPAVEPALQSAQQRAA
jgi:hypothetical protein